MFSIDLHSHVCFVNCTNVFLHVTRMPAAFPTDLQQINNFQKFDKNKKSKFRNTYHLYFTKEKKTFACKNQLVLQKGAKTGILLTCVEFTDFLVYLVLVGAFFLLLLALMTNVTKRESDRKFLEKEKIFQWGKSEGNSLHSGRFPPFLLCLWDRI